jgi:Dolichyl-phosphate-mannose-protein mannosyltransferase
MWTWERFEKLIDKFAVPLLGLLLIYGFARSVVLGTGKAYWYDELLTQLVTSQGTVSKMMSALHAPVDGQPPVFYVIEKFASRLVANQDIALRLPAALGAVCAMFCIFIFLQRQSGRLIALLSVAFFMTTSAFTLYAAEARPYSLVVACISFALICYQRAPSPKWVVLLGASLALAESLSYIAVLCMVPFAFAELFATLRGKKIRWGVCAALAIGAVPLLLFWNLLALNQAYYGPNHVALGFNLARAIHAYGDLLGTEGPIGMGFAMIAAIGIAIALRNSARESVASEPGDRISETVLIAGLLGLPFIADVFVLATHAPMATRYFLPCALGLSLSFGLTLARMPKPATLFFAAYLLATVGLAEQHFWRTIGAERRDLANKGAVTAKVVESAGYQALPVVIPNGDILWLARYAFPHSPGRLAYVTQDQDGPGDTRDKGLVIAQRYVPIQVRRVSDFLAAHPKFMIYSEGGNSLDQWVTLRVLRDGWSVELLAGDGLRTLYLVEKSERASGGS